jgi:hypothetical protein
MPILKGGDIDWRERRFISKLCMDQSVTLGLDEEGTRSVKTGEWARQVRCLSPILFNLYSEYLTKQALEGLGDFKTGEQVILTMKLHYTARLID